MASETAVATVRRQNYELEQTGLLVQGELSFEEWSGIGTWLETVDRAIQWWIGDWMAYGESRYGEQYVQAINATGWALATIKQYQWVAERVPVKNRRPELSFFHHREVADMPPDEQVAWLGKAMTGTDGDSWGVDRLRREINHAKRGTEAKLWVMVAATDQDDAEKLLEKFKAEGREAKIR
jgi:hypothetical protein